MLRSTNIWGCGLILISCDWILCLAPYFWGDGEIAPNFAKNFRCPRLASCHNQTAERMKTENILSNSHAIFGEKYVSLPLPILVNRGGRVWGSEWTTACHSSPLVGYKLLVTLLCWYFAKATGVNF